MRQSFVNFAAINPMPHFFELKEGIYMKILIKNISKLFLAEEKPETIQASGSSMAVLPCVEDAFLLLEDNRIHSYGKMTDLDTYPSRNTVLKEIDVTGRFVFPAFCDSHTHIVFAASREAEFIDKISGLSYEEIAKRGGGILNSAQKLALASEDELYYGAIKRLTEVISTGTGAIEIKSGYGLNLENEIKILKVIRRLKATIPMPIKATFLGAHAVPTEYRGRQGDYVKLIINEMIPEIGSEGLADYVDVFCDKGFFTVEETDKILNAALKFGLKPKIHANELDISGGVQVGVKNNAVSVDHLERIGQEEIEALTNGRTIPTLLPGTSFFLKIPYAPARDLINAGLPVALASDYNPGSCPSGNMQLVLSLASIYYRMLPEEAIQAATINGARAMEIQYEAGTICPGKRASFFITKEMPSVAYLPYAFGENKIETMYFNGKPFKSLAEYL